MKRAVLLVFAAAAGCTTAAPPPEPARTAQGGCTDGGSTLFVVRMPGRAAQVRQGTCGGPALHSRLISAVY